MRNGYEHNQKQEKRAPLVRCAIYTRKSTEEGLDQEFRSSTFRQEDPKDSHRSIIRVRRERNRSTPRLSRPLAPGRLPTPLLAGPMRALQLRRLDTERRRADANEPPRRQI